MLLGHHIVLAAFCHIGVRSYQHVSVNRWGCVGGETALVIRRRVNRDGKELSCLFIQHIILTLKALYRVIRVAQHLRDFRCVHTGAVNDPLRLKGVSLSRYYPDILCLISRDAGYLLSKMEFHTVLACILSQTDGVLHRIEDTGRRHIHGKLTACVRIDAVDLVLVDHAHALDTVLLTNRFVL